MFAPEMGVVEDAATGSAAGPLGAYLVRHKRVRADGDGETRIRIEQGVEILTGLPAGHRNGDGSFGENTVFGKVDRRLGQMAKMMKDFE